MNALVTGGASSGKSAFAERLACSLSPTRTYVATMRDDGTEAHARIERHRVRRAHLGFSTIECADDLTPAIPDTQNDGVALLEDLGNLTAHALFAPDGTMVDPKETLDHLEQEVIELFNHYAHVVLVGNDVGSEGPSPYATTQAWVRLMGSLCCRLAVHADIVTEVVAGSPLVVKGRLP